MKLTLLAPLLLSSTAFAGVGRWSRRQEIVICRPGTPGDCPSGQTCQYGTRNPERPGYDGQCVADTSSMPSSSSVSPTSSSSSAPSPGPSVVICRNDADCSATQQCQYVTRNPERPGYDGACVEKASASSSSAGPAPSGGACTMNTDCPETQFCDSSASTGPSTCVNYRDCRFGGCPGGSCVAQSYDPSIDKRDPNQPFYCDFASVPPSPSASSASATSSASSGSSMSSGSSSASATSSAPSGMPSVVICANDSECTDSQYCRYVTRNPDGSGKNGACTDFSDCRGPIGCGSNKGAQICEPPAYYPGLYYKDPTVNFTCVAADCRTAGCSTGNFCSYDTNVDSYLCVPNNVTCQATGCPAGETCTVAFASGGTTYSCQRNVTSDCTTFGCPIGQRCEVNGTLPQGAAQCVVAANATDCRTTPCTDGGKCELVVPFGAIGGYQCNYPNKGYDCRVGGCESFDTCTYYSKGQLSGFLCLDSAALPAGQDCRVGGCPGGTCGFNGAFFQCYFNVTSSTSMPASSSTSAAGSGSMSGSSGPTGTAHPTSQVGPTQGASTPPPPPASASMSPAPPASSSVAPAPPKSSSMAPAPPASSSSAPAPPSNCNTDYGYIIALLQEIKQDVEDIKCKLGI